LEEHFVSIFRVEEISSAKTSKQAGGYIFDPDDGGDMFLLNVS
jgi:hypothetical protein